MEVQGVVLLVVLVPVLVAGFLCVGFLAALRGTRGRDRVQLFEVFCRAVGRISFKRGAASLRR